MTPDDMHIRRMTRDELDTLIEWAAREGWNPGLDDAEAFWNADPDGFVAAELNGEMNRRRLDRRVRQALRFHGLFHCASRSPRAWLR